MYNLYETISSLCEQKGIKPGRMCNDLGISRGTITDLKAGRKQSLSAETLSKIANYFDVSIDFLLGNEQKETPLINGDEELTEYLEELKNRPEMRMLFSLAKGASKEDVEKAVRIVEAALGK